MQQPSFLCRLLQQPCGKASRMHQSFLTLSTPSLMRHRVQHRPPAGGYVPLGLQSELGSVMSMMLRLACKRKAGSRNSRLPSAIESIMSRMLRLASKTVAGSTDWLLQGMKEAGLVRLAFRQQHDVIKEVVGLRGGLQKSNNHSGLSKVSKVTQGAGDLEGGAAVKPCADLIQEQSLLGTHQELT